jgi:3',5'-cyclic-AMP phosphodiesterase
MQILQITDTHLYGSANGRLRGVETDSSLRATLDDAFSRAPNYQAVLVTGDLVQDDKSGYLRFRSFFGNLPKPVLCIPGNHDEPETMRAELSGDPFRICGTHTIGDWSFVMLDSYDPGHVGGRLTKNELARLDTALNAAPKHAMVCLHHHPIVMGSRWLDSVGLADAQDFWSVRRQSRQCAFVCNALHRRAISAQERSLRGGLGSAGLPKFRVARRWTYRLSGALGRIGAIAANRELGAHPRCDDP